jgi:hypothetical protein
LISLSLTNTTLAGVINLTGLPIINISIGSNDLTDITGLSGLPLQSGDISNNQFPISVVNTFLVRVDAAGLSGTYTANTSGQTPSATPSGAGATAKTNLIGRGYTVSTD